MDHTVPQQHDVTHGPADASEPLLVSVITVCLNDVAHVGATMESVLAQGYPHIEYVVVDGGSTDGSLDVIRSFADRFGARMRWTSGPDAGIYDAMNTGLSMCTGELVGVLNSGDMYVSDAVSAVVEASRTHRDAGLIYGDAQIIDESGALLRTETATCVVAKQRPDRMPMCHQSLFVTRQTYEALGGYDATYLILGDYDFVLRAIEAEVPALHIHAPIAQSREGGVSSTQMKRSNRERELIRVAHGGNPVVERVRRWRHTVNQSVHDAIVGRGGSAR